MYLSKLALNERDSKVYRELGNAHALHQRIMQGFPNESREHARADWHVLYRHEPDSLVILVQSTIQPDWDRLPDGYLHCHGVKPMEAMLQNLKSGQRLQFRLRANPSKRDSKTRKTMGFFHGTEQVDWLNRKGEQHGFLADGVDTIPASTILGFKSKGSPPIKIATVLFQGSLEVVNVALFTQALMQGIGRGRSYGCGLLSIARLQA